MVGTPVYLRDLNEVMAGQIVSEWKRTPRKYSRLLKAYEESRDIKVGYYLHTPRMAEED